MFQSYIHLVYMLLRTAVSLLSLLPSLFPLSMLRHPFFPPLYRSPTARAKPPPPKQVLPKEYVYRTITRLPFVLIKIWRVVQVCLLCVVYRCYAAIR